MTDSSPRSPDAPRIQALVVMGVSGAGKTTIGRQVADTLGWELHDADDYHPPQNVEKMSRGEALNDTDREPWLKRLRDILVSRDNVVITCSALKARYRTFLGLPNARVLLLYLKATPELVSARLAARANHFMPPSLIPSQFETLEEPSSDTLIVCADDPIDQILERVLDELRSPTA